MSAGQNRVIFLIGDKMSASLSDRTFFRSLWIYKAEISVQFSEQVP
jgi:hypothetical protein